MTIKKGGMADLIELVDELSDRYDQNFMGQTVSQMMQRLTEEDQARVKKLIKGSRS